MMLLDNFLWRAAFAGLGVALVAAPLGCFVVWRNASVLVGALALALCMAMSVSALRGRGYPMDTLLGVLAHSALAFGLVAVSFVSGVRVDLNAYLFGDILAVSVMDVWVIWAGVFFVVSLLMWRWRRLLIASVNEDLAQAAGQLP